jgi:hypothetical protein
LPVIQIWAPKTFVFNNADTAKTTVENSQLAATLAGGFLITIFQQNGCRSVWGDLGELVSKAKAEREEGFRPNNFRIARYSPRHRGGFQ